MSDISESRREQLARAHVDAEARLADLKEPLTSAERVVHLLERNISERSRLRLILQFPQDFPDVDITAIRDELPAAENRAVVAERSLPDALIERSRLRRLVDEAEQEEDQREAELNSFEDERWKAEAAERTAQAEQVTVTRRRRGDLALKWLLGVVAVVGGWNLSDVVRDSAERDPRVTTTAVVAAIVSAALVTLLLLYRNDVTRVSDYPPVVWLCAGWLFFCVVVPLSGGRGRHDHGFLADYCNYGSQSKSQFEGCMRHVDPNHIAKLRTPAARFASRDVEDCGPTSGPFCEQALAYRLLQDQAEP